MALSFSIISGAAYAGCEHPWDSLSCMAFNLFNHLWDSLSRMALSLSIISPGTAYPAWL